MNAGLIEAGRFAQRPYHSPNTKFRGGLHRLAGDEFRPLPSREAAGALRVRLSDTISSVPADRTARYTSHAGKSTSVLGCGPSTSPKPAPHNPSQTSTISTW